MQGQEGILLVGLCTSDALEEDAREKVEVWRRRRRHRGLENLPCRLFLLFSAPFLLLLRSLELSLSSSPSLNFGGALCLSLSPGLNKLLLPILPLMWFDNVYYKCMKSCMPLCPSYNLRQLWYVFCINGPMQVLYLPQSRNDTRQ